MSEFDEWLKTVCFQKPTPEAYGLAKRAWAAAQQSGWVSIEDCPPELPKWGSFRKYLVFNGDSVFEAKWANLDPVGFYTSFSGGPRRDITHWRRLPSPPEAIKDKEQV